MHKGICTVYFTDNNKTKKILSLSKALEVARKYCGNNTYTKIPNANIYLFGPGNGTTSVVVREIG